VSAIPAPARFDLEFVEEGLLTSPGSSPSPPQPRADGQRGSSSGTICLWRWRDSFAIPEIGRFANHQRIAKENAYSPATALPDVIPESCRSVGQGEFASDTTVITVNQIRMALLIAAADRQVGRMSRKSDCLDHRRSFRVARRPPTGFENSLEG
jgi:hypothetical protein